MLSPKRGLEDIDAALRRQRDLDAQGSRQLTAEEVAQESLAILLESMAIYSDEQLEVLYQHLVGELGLRGLDEQVLGEVVDVAGISLDEEMSEMIKMVRKMRTNLDVATASGKVVSNREIRETLSACINTVKALTSHQKSIRTLERQRNLENVLIEVLGEISEESQEEFKRRFRERLEEYQE